MVEKIKSEITKAVFGITIGDVVKAIGFLSVGFMVYYNQQAINQKLFDGLAQNTKNIEVISDRSNKTLEVLQEYVANMDNYLSATTGKQFRYGTQK